jgi:transcriptional regulator NrdR family protein
MKTKPQPSLQHEIQLKQQELRSLESTISIVESDLRNTASSNYNSKQELEQLGEKLSELQQEACIQLSSMIEFAKDEHSRIIAELQSLNSTKNHLTQTLQ